MTSYLIFLLLTATSLASLGSHYIDLGQIQKMANEAELAKLDEPVEPAEEPVYIKAQRQLDAMSEEELEALDRSIMETVRSLKPGDLR